MVQMRRMLYLVVFVFAASSLTSCCFLGFIGKCGPKTFCCEQYSGEELFVTPDLMYCTRMSEAAAGFIRGGSGDTLNTETQRLEIFTALYAKLEDCDDTACIYGLINSAPDNLDNFKSLFERSRSRVDTVSGLEQSRHELTLCGLGDGIERRIKILKDNNGS